MLILSVNFATITIGWRCRLLSTFFGLTSEHQEALYEELFILKQHGNWSFSEAYSLPTGLRRWFLTRLIKHFEDKKAQAAE